MNPICFKQVKTMTYTYETCKDREFQLSLATEEPFIRYGCLHLRYKVSGKAWHGALRCDFHIMANQYRLDYVNITGDDKYDVWYEKSISVNNFWFRFKSPLVSVLLFFDSSFFIF